MDDDILARELDKIGRAGAEIGEIGGALLVSRIRDSLTNSGRFRQNLLGHRDLNYATHLRLRTLPESTTMLGKPNVSAKNSHDQEDDRQKHNVPDPIISPVAHQHPRLLSAPTPPDRSTRLFWSPPRPEGVPAASPTSPLFAKEGPNPTSGGYGHYGALPSRHAARPLHCRRRRFFKRLSRWSSSRGLAQIKKRVEAE